MLTRSKTLTQKAAEAIRARIVGGDFELGAALSENGLAAELGVSKTPVREALLQLKAEGLVSIQPQRGSFVFDMTPAQIVELGELREVLELAALEQSLRRRPQALQADLRRLLDAMTDAVALDDVVKYRKLDSVFHDALFRHCGNGYMIDCYRSFAFRVDALRIRLSVDTGLNRASLAEHAEIVAHVGAGDLPAARHSLSAHMQGTIRQYNANRAARPGT